MSNMSRYEWHDQYATINERMKGFLQNPGDEQMEALLAEMRSYADAAKSGCIEIPEYWTSYN